MFKRRRRRRGKSAPQNCTFQFHACSKMTEFVSVVCCCKLWRTPSFKSASLMNGPNRLTTLLPLLLAAGVVCCHNKCEKSSETIAPLNSKRQLSLKNSKKKKSRLPPPLPELLVGNSIREKERKERERRTLLSAQWPQHKTVSRRKRRRLRR